MLRHLEPNTLDTEPLLLNYPVEDDELDEDGNGAATEEAEEEDQVDDMAKKTGGGGATNGKTRRRRRRLSKQVSYRSGTQGVVIRQGDMLIKVTEEEDEDDVDARRAVSVVVQYGACGLAACGQSPTWRGLANVLRFLYAYYFWNWTVIFASLAFCTTVSLVYEAWMTGTPHGQAAVVMALLPTLNLIWILMMFTWHVLCWGVWHDYSDLDGALHCLQAPLQSSLARSSLTLLVALLVNVPVLLSFLIFILQTAGSAPDWMWQSQFYVSFWSNLCLALLFFVGSLLGQDHTPEPSSPPPPPPSCFPPLLAWLWCSWFTFLHSDVFQAMRVYVRSAFVEGGAFNEAPSTWGRHADDFIPTPVDLEGDRRFNSRYPKRWPTPWYLGWYTRQCLSDCAASSHPTPPQQRRPRASSSSGAPSSSGGPTQHRRFDRSRCFLALVVGPWVLLLLSILSLLALLSWSVRAYAVLGIVGGYFVLLPLLYATLERLVGHNRTAEMVVDVVLLLVMLGGYLVAISIASVYLGGLFLPVVLLANLANLLFHLPAIRDRDYPPPQNHAQSLAFQCKAMCHTILNGARAGAFVTILLVLSLVLAMRTVPNPITNGSNGNANGPGLQGARHQAGPLTAGGADAGVGVPYAFCASSFAGLSVLQLAYISDAAYLQNMTLIKDTVDKALSSEWDFVVSEVPLVAEAGRAYLPSILELRDDKRKVLVYATRGTDEVFDLFQDLDGWCEALVIQTASYLFPLYGSPIFQPFMQNFVGSTHHLVQALSSMKDVLLNRNPRPCSVGKKRGGKSTAGGGCRYYCDQLYEYVVANVLQSPVYSDYSLLFTGHSLGGGVAQIVGARTQRPAVTFSAPGVVLSRRKFGIELHDINNYLVNIVPQGDLIPLIDAQGVKQQFISCEMDRLSVQCHSLTHTIEVIETACRGTWINQTATTEH